MARPLRLEYPGALYHVTARGDGRGAIYADDADRAAFLDLLGKEIRQQRWRCYAYCLMTNHYHLLLETPDANLVKGMRRLNGVYTQAFNRRHGHVGHVLQGRYKAIVVDRQSYLLELCRYVVLNPVRAKMVTGAERWPWSSYRATAGHAPCPSWLETGWVLSQFGREIRKAAIAYRRFVAQGMKAESPWESLRGQIWLGDEEFLAEMEKRVGGGKKREGVPGRMARPAGPTSEEVLASVARAFGVDTDQVLDRSHPEAFRCAVYLFRRAANLSLKETADLAGVSLPRISQIQSAMEADGFHAGTGAEAIKLLVDYKIKA